MTQQLLLTLREKMCRYTKKIIFFRDVEAKEKIVKIFKGFACQAVTF